MKRVLLFLLLLGLGWLTLQLAIGDEPMPRAAAKTTTDVDKPQDDPNRGNTPGGLAVTQGKVTAQVTQRGPVDFPKYREVRTADGRVRLEQLFVLKAEDSKPVNEGLQQLDRVLVRLFDAGKHTANLEARQAFVEVGKDANGKPSFEASKDLDLRDMVLTTMPGSRLAGLRLELGDTRVLIGDDEVLLRTAPTQPVLMVLDGERKATLRGKGAQARLPRDRDGALQRADVELLSDPILEADGLEVRAKGRLHYLEDLTAGLATVTLQDDVQLDLLRTDLTLPGMARPVAKPGIAAAPQRTTVRGDQFQGWLLRGKERQQDGSEKQLMAWRQLVLHGAPAVVEVPGGRLSTPRLTVLPGLFGEAFLVTAHGGASRLEQTGPMRKRADGTPRDPVVATAQRRIHVARPLEHNGALHRAMGFPQWTLRPFGELQVVIAEGAARVDSGPDTGRASQGVRIWRRDGRDGGIVQGRGEVQVEQRPERPGEPALLATGSDGFWLVDGGGGEDGVGGGGGGNGIGGSGTDGSGVGEERLRLGPPPPLGDENGAEALAWRQHHYDVRHGDAHLQGHGSCVLERDAGGTRVHLLAPDASIAAKVPSDGLELANVRQLRCLSTGRDLRDLDVAGWPLELRVRRGRETVIARAPRLVQIGPAALRLLPVPDDAPAGLWRELAETQRMPSLRRESVANDGERPQEVEVRGPRIDVHHVGGRDALVDAEVVGDEEPTIYARLTQAGQNEPTTIACRAGRLRLLPFVLTREVRQLHTGSRASVFGDMTFHTAGAPWLLMDDVRDFQLDDPDQGHLEGRGRRLLVAQGGQAALFVGDADTQAPAIVRRVHRGKEVTMQGARVRVFRDTDVQLHALGSFADRGTFLPPTVTLHEPGKKGLLSHMQAACRGNIEVLPDGVMFLGPVLAVGLRPDGSVDPDGMRIDAQDLRLTRNLKSGDIHRVFAKQVALDWPRMSARTAELEIDLEQHTCVATDPRGAEVAVPGWPVFRSPRFECNYVTMTMRAPRLRGTKDRPADPLPIDGDGPEAIQR